MGMFDKINSSGITKNIDPEDSIPIEYCSNVTCNYYDNRGRCSYESCKYKYPVDILQHSIQFKNCEICDNEFTNIFPNLGNTICSECKTKLKKMIRGE